MSLNKVLLIGNVGKDPEVRYVSDNLAVANFSVATTKKGYKTNDGKEVPDKAESMDPASFMASAVQLAADFRLEISDCFVTDCPELLLDNNALRSYGAPEENGIKGITELEGFAVLGYGETLQDLH